MQVLACFGASDKSALLDHMSVGETMHLIRYTRLRMMYVQVLACFGASDKSALLDHMSVGETMHLIRVSLT